MVNGSESFVTACFGAVLAFGEVPMIAGDQSTTMRAVFLGDTGVCLLHHCPAGWDAEGGARVAAHGT